MYLYNIQSEMNIYIFIFNETELKYFNNGIKYLKILGIHEFHLEWK